MALRKLVRSNYGGKSPVSIKYENLHSFKEGVILLCQSILETRRILDLHGSALFTIPLRCIRRQAEQKFKKRVYVTNLSFDLENYVVVNHVIIFKKSIDFKITLTKSPS